jgi:Zn-dependent protease/CBS domain-containing protein
VRGGIRVARIFGINIRIDWSWLLIALLITWNLSAVFASAHPAWGTVLTWGIAVIAALLFFGSVLVHELAHSLVAKARGIPVRSIRLFLFGGVSNIEREPPSPGAEFLMAFVGPLTSIVLGVSLVVIAGIGAAPAGDAVFDPAQIMEQLSPVTTLLAWLGSINVLLGLFNLIPGFPLDGGRVVRSVFWAITDDLRRATRWASWIGQGIAWLMIGAGIAMIFGVQIPFFGQGFLGGLWLAFIGWFLNSSAITSYRQVVVQDILEDVPVERVMRSDPAYVSSKISVDALVHDGILGTDDHAFPVIDDGQLVGLVTLEDVRTVPRGAWADTTVADIMTPAGELVTVSADKDTSEAMTKLQRRDVRQLPVMRNGSLAGLLRRRDIVRWLQLHSEMESR